MNAAIQWERSRQPRESWELIERRAAYYVRLGYIVKKKNKHACKVWRVYVIDDAGWNQTSTFIGELSMNRTEAKSTARMLIQMQRNTHER